MNELPYLTAKETNERTNESDMTKRVRASDMEAFLVSAGLRSGFFCTLIQC
jgi:hypothetical protein